MKKIGFLIIISIFVFIACEDDDPAAVQLKKDIELIETYLQDSSLTAQSTADGLYYIIEEEGTGNAPGLRSVIKANYKGMLLSGEVFDEGTVQDYPLYVYIKGWQKGMPLLRAGGKGTFFIPSGLAYGSTARSGIPANSVLIFEVELLNVAN